MKELYEVGDDTTKMIIEQGMHKASQDKDEAQATVPDVSQAGASEATAEKTEKLEKAAPEKAAPRPNPTGKKEGTQAKHAACTDAETGLSTAQIVNANDHVHAHAQGPEHGQSISGTLEGPTNPKP